MNLLLDTHTLLWWLDDSPNLSKKARRAIADGANVVFVSAAVVWEIRIKEALGKLTIPQNFHDVLDREPFEKLPITIDHAHAIADLPAYHRDPFERMLIAQAKSQGFAIVTHDTIFRRYEISIIKA
jgi:PIN domain nuclease of toxin-antitoxin system